MCALKLEERLIAAHYSSQFIVVATHTSLDKMAPRNRSHLIFSELLRTYSFLHTKEKVFRDRKDPFAVEKTPKTQFYIVYKNYFILALIPIEHAN